MWSFVWPVIGLLCFSLAGCGGGGGDSFGSPASACDRFGNFTPGEVATYRLTEATGVEHIMSVTAVEITSDRAKFFITRDEVTTGIYSEESNLDLPRGCPYIEPPFVDDRTLLVLGLPSRWGSATTQDGSNFLVSDQRTESCTAASRATDAGTFSVERCRNYFVYAGPVEEPFDDEFAVVGRTPGSGFIARILNPDLQDEPSAVLVGWNGR